MESLRYELRRLTLLGVAVTFGCDASPEGSDVDPLRLSSWSVTAASTVTVGGYDERPEYTLHDVWGATRLSDGRIVIANRGSSELKMFDSTGVHVLDAGGEGDGPGELRNIFRMVRLSGDTLLVLSTRPGMTWYGPTGDYVRSITRNMNGVPNHPCRIGEGGRWDALPDGTVLRLLEDNFAPEHCPPRPEGVFRVSGLLGMPSPSGETFDTIALLPATERLGIRSRVFGHMLVLGLAPERIYAGDTDSDVILALSLEGDTLATFQTPFESAVVPDEAKKTGVIEVPQRGGGTRFFPGFTNYPERYPRFARLVVDALGYLWVMKYPELLIPNLSFNLAHPSGHLMPEGGAEWRVLSPAGELVVEVRTPPDLFVFEIGEDYVLGLSRDEFDVESVLVHTLTRE